MNRLLLPALSGLAALALAGPAAAQATAPVPLDGRTVEINRGTPIEAQGAAGLPGVGLDAGGNGRLQSPRGPGGLQNGIGAYGTMAPDTTGTAGNTIARVPGAIPNTNSGTGIPISQQGEPAN